MSCHMLFGLKVKQPSGLRLHHFFNRWDAPAICIVFFISGVLDVFRLRNALSDSNHQPANSPSAALK